MNRRVSLTTLRRALSTLSGKPSELGKHEIESRIAHDRELAPALLDPLEIERIASLERGPWTSGRPSGPVTREPPQNVRPPSVPTRFTKTTKHWSIRA